MAKIISRKCEGQELANVAKLRAQFDADQRRFASDDRAGDVLPAAAGYVLGYPLFLEMIGHEWRAESERTAAYYALDAAHAGAVRALMQEAERLGIDSAPLWEYGRVCRELLANEPWKHYVGPYDTWPECLGDTRLTLPDDYRAAIRDGEGALMRLNVKLGIEADATRTAVEDTIVHSGAVLKGERPRLLGGDGFTVAALRDMTGLGNNALNRYAKTANVTTPRRGERDFRYTLADVRAILQTIIASTAEDKLRDQCKSALRNLPEIAD